MAVILCDRTVGLLPEGWEKSVTPSRIPYYINHVDGSTHWEHPIFTQVISELDGVNGIKYGAYRAAMKLRATQKLTHLNEVNHRILKDTFREFGLGPGSGHNNEVLSIDEVEALLVSLFQLVSRDREQFMEAEICVELTLSFLLRCLDSGRTGAIKVRSLKVVLIALSHASLEHKYEFMYSQVSTPNSIGISQSNLKILLQDLLMLTDSIVESNTFDHESIDDAVESCWNLSNIQSTDTLNLQEFNNWMLKEPLCIVWLPTLHRVAAAETVKHEAKCAKCKEFPIVGFRYRCLKCSNVDLCQNCFWTQKTLKNHKLTHPTREYCLATTTGDDVRDFMKQLKNKLTRRYRRRPLKINYLSYPTTRREPDERIPDQSPVFDNVHTRINLLAARLQELEDGVEPLEESTGPSQPHVSSTPEAPPPRPAAMVEAGTSSIHAQPPPPLLSPILPPPAKPDTQDLETKLKLESCIIELQGRNKTEAETRRQLQDQVATLENSRLADMEVMCELEQRVHDLQESNNLYKEKVSQLLATPPQTKTVRVPVPVAIQSPPSSMTEVRTQGVNTPYRPSRDGWSYMLGSQTSSMLGGEEEEMEAILRELLEAFPKQTSKSVPSDVNTKLFKAVEDVGTGLSTLGNHIKQF